MSTLIELQNISVVFDQRSVLDRINLTLSKNKITTLIGPNGAGKSTLVRVLLGLQPINEGRILRAKNLTIGYVPQKLQLNDALPLSVKRFLNFITPFTTKQLDDALKLVGASHLLNQDMHKLSGGENQRVLIARALLQQPDILILDEPAQGVDIQGQVELYALIAMLRKRFECSIFMVSHDLHLVMAKTDDVICLQHHICCSGSPDNITQHPNYIELFGHQHHNTFAFYQHNHEHHHDLSGSPVQGKACHCSDHSHGHHHV